MFRVKKIKYWRRKKPLEGRSNAKSCHCLSEHFHRSALEGRTCDELRLRKIASDIKDYEREFKIDLRVNGYHIANYYVDFKIIHNDGHIEFLESKGIEFETWKIKWKLLEALHEEIEPNSTLSIVK